MIIETERLTIHVSSEDEMHGMIEKQTDKELIKAYNEMLQESLAHQDSWNWYAAWIIELKNGKYIGDLCFKGLNDDGSVEIGYGIIDDYQGKGYATEAVEAVVEWALKQSGVQQVEAETEQENKKSQRVLEKCGFTSLGINGEEGPRFGRTREE